MEKALSNKVCHIILFCIVDLLFVSEKEEEIKACQGNNIIRGCTGAQRI